VARIGKARINAALCAIALLAAATCAPNAFAHATLKSSAPSDKEVIDAATPPAEVVLHFSEPVEVQENGIQVFAPNGNRVDHGTASGNGTTTIRQAVEIEHLQGEFAVSWRVTSEDSHTMSSYYTFVVGSKQAGSSQALTSSKDAAKIPKSKSVAFGIARFIAILSLLIVAGGGVFAAGVAPTWRPRKLVLLLAILIVALLVSYVIDTAIAHGISISDAMRWEHIRIEASVPYGSASLVTLALAVVMIAPAAMLQSATTPLGAGTRTVVALLFLALAASMSLTGHATTNGPTAVRLPLDMMHVMAAAIWIGGLVQLRLLTQNAGQHVDEIKLFSAVAFGCVITLLATGTYAVWTEVGLAPNDIVESSWGRIVLAKLLIYASIVPLAWLNRSTYLPAIERRPDSASHLLRQYVYRELFLLIAIVALTAWLISTSPATS
jgi:copper transport protein